MRFAWLLVALAACTGGQDLSPWAGTWQPSGDSRFTDPIDISGTQDDRLAIGLGGNQTEWTVDADEATLVPGSWSYDGDHSYQASWGPGTATLVDGVSITMHVIYDGAPHDLTLTH